MYKFSAILPFLFLLTIVACTKDDQPDSSTTLDGIWRVTAMSCTDGEAITTVQNQSFTGTFNSVADKMESDVTFTTDGNAVSLGTIRHTVTITIPNMADQTTEVLQENFLGEGPYEVLGNTLTISVPGSPATTIKIISNDGKTMELSTDFSLEADGIDAGSKNFMTGTFVFTLEKM